ncbi:MAG: carboxylesterase [Paracrocinitomix sp.]|jgi:carboxylesterase
MTNVDILPGAEPLSHNGGPTGVLVIHGFTGSPQSMDPIAQACIGAGHTVEMPRLPGHGTSVEDMLSTSWADWSAHVEHAYLDLASRCERVFVTGLSMGGALTLWLASRHNAIAGIAIVNSAGEPSAERTAALAAVVEAGRLTIEAIGNDIAKPDVVELAYDETPLAPLLSLVEAVNNFDLEAITCPTLIMVSDQDHVVPPETATYIAGQVNTTATVVHLTKSFHVATLDHDAELINSQIVDFIASNSK